MFFTSCKKGGIVSIKIQKTLEVDEVKLRSLHSSLSFEGEWPFTEGSVVHADQKWFSEKGIPIPCLHALLGKKISFTFETGIISGDTRDLAETDYLAIESLQSKKSRPDRVLQTLKLQSFSAGGGSVRTGPMIFHQFSLLLTPEEFEAFYKLELDNMMVKMSFKAPTFVKR